MLNGSHTPTRTWRSRLALALAFAATVVIGILMVVMIGGIIAGVAA